MSKRPAVADLLKAIKKQKAERDSRTRDWAAADLKQSCGLEEGAKIYVRYEYQDIGMGTPSGMDVEPPGEATPPPPVKESGVPTPRMSINLSIREVMSDESSPGTDGLAPGERILSQKVVWWPAVISAYKSDDFPGDAVPSVRQVYDKLKSSATKAARTCVEQLLEQKGEAPVWQIDYEARDAMESESVPAFFIDRERLCHLHPEWAESAYRADKDVKDPSELEDDLIIDAKTAIRLAYNLDESGDEEDDDQSGIAHEDLGVRTIMSKFAGVMRTFLTRASESGSASVTAEEVWEIFADCANETREGSGGEKAEGGGSAGGEGDGGKASLQEQPFPRLEE